MRHLRSILIGVLLAIPHSAVAQGHPLQPDSVRHLIGILGGRHADEMRRGAALRLVEAGPSIAPALRESFFGDEPSAQGVAFVLRQIGPAGWDILLEAVISGPPRARIAAEAALSGEYLPAPTGMDAWACSLLNDARPAVRLLAVKALSPGYGSPDESRLAANLPALRGALRDPDSEVRIAAAHGLSRAGPVAASAAPDLVLLLADREGRAREAAIEALRYLRGAESGIVVPALARIVAEDPSATNRRFAVDALGEAGDPAALDFIVQATLDRDQDVSQSATAALGELAGSLPPAGRMRALGVLARETAARDSATRDIATRALAGFGAEADSLLAEASRDPAGGVAITAISVLAHRPARPGVVAALLASLGDPRRDVADAGADAVAGLGGDALPLLDSLARSATPGAGVRRAAELLRSVLAIPVAGQCYELTRGEWDPRGELGEDSLFTVVPRRIRFTTRLMPQRRGGPRWMEIERTGESDRWTTGSWRATDVGIELVWSNGFSGVRVLLTAAASRLDGTARTFWDFSRDSQSATVTGVRIPCGPERIGPEAASGGGRGDFRLPGPLAQNADS